MEHHQSTPPFRTLRFLPPWVNGGWGIISIATGLYLILYLAGVYFQWGGPENVSLILTLAPFLLNLLALLAALRVATYRELDLRLRLAWFILALTHLSGFIADAISFYFGYILGVDPFPSIADFFYLCIYPLFLTGLLKLPVSPLNKREGWQVLLNLAVVMTAATMFSWYFIIHPTAVATEGDLFVQFIATAYTVGDLVLVAGLVSILFRRPDRDTQTAMLFFLVGLILTVVSDVVFSYTSLLGTYQPGGWTDTGWVISLAFFIWAAVRQLYRSPAASAATPAPRWLNQVTKFLPFVAIALSFGLTFYVAIIDFNGSDTFWLLIGAVVITFLVLAGQSISSSFTNLSVRTKLVASFLVVTIIPLGLLVYLNHQTSRTNLIETANHSLLSAASQTANRIDDFITFKLNTVRTQAQLPDFVDYLTMTPAQRANSQLETEVNFILQAFVRNDPYIASYALLDRQGIDVADTFAADVGLDKSDRNYFKEAVRTGQPYVSPVGISPTEQGLLSLYFSTPVRDERGEIIGVLRMRYKAALLQDMVAQKGLLSEESTVVVLDENHVFLADGGEPELILKSLVPLDPDHLAELQAVYRMPEGTPEELTADEPDFEQGVLNIDNQPYFQAGAGVSEIEQIAVVRLKTQPWIVGAEQPQSAFLATVEAQTRNTLVLTLGIAAVVAVIAFGVSQLLAAPITRLTAVAAQVGAGDLTVRASIDSHDEIGTLATTFNLMTSQLQTTLAGLEQRVADRTRALEISMDVSRRLSTILDEKQLVAEVVEQVRAAFDYYYAHIYLFDPKHEKLLMMGGTGEAGQIMLARSHALERGQGLVGRAAETNTVVLIPDVQKEPGWLPNPLLPDTQAEVAVPITIGDQVLGVLDVQHNVAGGLQPADADLIQAIANQVAIGLQNARAYAQTQRQAEREAMVSAIGQKIQAAATVDSAMQVAVRELGRALTPARSQVRLTISQSTNGQK